MTCYGCWVDKDNRPTLLLCGVTACDECDESYVKPTVDVPLSDTDGTSAD